ncbi:MAG: amidohydrolase family protein [Nocardiopsaceae bacterium]|jgi:predicted TIM-barrel fold metal-dependent hydrolase|nr:amidohydrolase family protein [Nocardiopsaceae bacterium]
MSEPAARNGPDISSLVAIDVHTHVHRSVSAPAAPVSASLADMAAYFRTGAAAYTVDDLAAYYRERNMAAVTFTVDVAGRPDDPARPTNEEVAARARANSDVIIPFASIDPARGAAGVRAAERLIAEHGVRGFKFHPSSQGFRPDDRSAYPLYEVIQAAGLPALFHTGQTGAGAGTPGGGGLRLGYSNPIYLDDVAADFPDMPIILAHPSFPWQEEALAIATHKQQVYIDLSGWSPKYFPPILVQYANTLLRDKVMFGTDFPMLTPDRWRSDLEQTAIRDEVKPAIYAGNAARLLGLG